MLRFSLILVVFVALFLESYASILDNRTTNETITTSSNETVIRAERGGEKRQVYQPGPVIHNSLTPQAQPQNEPVPYLCSNPKCRFLNEHSLVPFIAAGVFMILAVVVYTILFCFVLRYLV
ncbi:hypothetical protein L3Y34_010693 [Caenorhabditis briggsae]|uniref:Uncharacterized protein n=1 Tax=Caenorhabditis briggsae TaxID=6238 RepID=A0AAE8ZM36_CAEBR|nr:hypothetical protein L3Y34_010693 [Caenorhabditis briggsae]